MQRITVAEAAAELGMTPLTLRVILQQKIEPICKCGTAVKRGSKYVYIIYRESLDKVEKELKDG